MAKSGIVVLCLLSLMASVGCNSLGHRLMAPRENQQLANAVAQKLHMDGLSDDASVKITTNNGIVTLRGTAATDEYANRITATVQRVQGVDRVESRLRIAAEETSATKPRRTLIEDVRVALEKDMPRRGPRLAVEADEGTIYLSGIVPDAGTEVTAVRIALAVDGVQRVEDNLLSER